MKPHEKARAAVNALTDEQVSQLGESATRLYHEAQSQLTEWKMWMSEQMALVRMRDGSTPAEMVAKLKQWVSEVKLAYSRNGKELEVAYDFPDELVLWLLPQAHQHGGSAEALGYVFPEELKKALIGGMVYPQNVKEPRALAPTPGSPIRLRG